MEHRFFAAYLLHDWKIMITANTEDDFKPLALQTIGQSLPVLLDWSCIHGRNHRSEPRHLLSGYPVVYAAHGYH